jgi:hypothetical protein
MCQENDVESVRLLNMFAPVVLSDSLLFLHHSITLPYSTVSNVVHDMPCGGRCIVYREAHGSCIGLSRHG